MAIFKPLEVSPSLHYNCPHKIILIGNKKDMDSKTPPLKAQGFLEWLRKDTWTSEELLNWCYGFGLGLGRESDEPYLYLLDALTADHERDLMANCLARRIARTLQETPTLDFDCAGPRTTLYNLFKLTASLDCPNELCGTLWDTYICQLSTPTPNMIGEVKVVFGDALAGNQYFHPELLAVWMEILNGNENPLFGSNPVNGWRGVLMQPDAHGHANHESMGMALKKMAIFTEDGHEHRSSRFRRYAMEAHTVWKLSREDFGTIAQQAAWPQWAVDALPETFMEKPNRASATASDLICPR